MIKYAFSLLMLVFSVSSKAQMLDQGVASMMDIAVKSLKNSETDAIAALRKAGGFKEDEPRDEPFEWDGAQIYLKHYRFRHSTLRNYEFRFISHEVKDTSKRLMWKFSFLFPPADKERVIEALKKYNVTADPGEEDIMAEYNGIRISFQNLTLTDEDDKVYQYALLVEYNVFD